MRRSNLLGRQFTNKGEDDTYQHIQTSLLSDIHPVPESKPFCHDDFRCIRLLNSGRYAIHLFFSRMVNSIFNQLAGNLHHFLGFLQPHAEIAAQRAAIFLAKQPILPAPEFRSSRRDLKIEPAVSSDLLRLIGRLCRTKSGTINPTSSGLI